MSTSSARFASSRRRGSTARRSSSLHGRRDLRRVRGACPRGLAARAALPVRHGEARGRGVPAHVQPPARHEARRAPVRERLRSAPGPARRGRRRCDLPRRARPWRAGADLRRRLADARLRLRRRRGARDDVSPRSGRRGLQRRHGPRDLRRRALRAVRPRRRLRARRPSMRRHGSASSSAASSTRSWRRASSASPRWSSSRTDCARPGTGSEPPRRSELHARAKRSPVDHPLPAPDALVRPWRTAAYVAVAVAAVELLLLLVIGGGKLAGWASDRVELAAKERVLAPARQTAAGRCAQAGPDALRRNGRARGPSSSS